MTKLALLLALVAIPAHAGVATASALVSISVPPYVSVNVPEPSRVRFASRRRHTAPVSIGGTEKMCVVVQPTPSKIIVTVYSP